MIENFHDYNERSYNRRLISYFLLKENTRTRKNDQKKKDETKNTTRKRHKKTKKNPLLFVLAMIWHRLACTTLCIHVLDSDKSILRGRCIRVWSILISILRFQLLGLVSYSTAFFTFSFLVFLLSFILYNSGSRTTVDGLGWNDESSLASIQTSCGLRYPFHCRLAYSHFLFCLFP